MHAFCSSFSDWVIGATSYGADLADMCIAHLTRGKVRAAYQRSPQLEKRRDDGCVVRLRNHAGRNFRVGP